MHTFFSTATLKILTILAYVGLAPAVFAATPLPDTPYTPIATLPGVSSTGVTFEQYAPAVFKIGIALGVILAVIMITIGGVEYVGSGASEELRSKAKNHITNALIGLIMIAAIWLVLGTINKNFVDIPFSIPPAPSATAVQAQAGGAAAPSPTGPTVVSGDEQAVRDQLSAAGITVFKRPCPDGVRYQDFPGGCTSVGGLPAETIGKLIALKKTCSCDIIVTGGSELGHKTHGVGLPRVDLSKNSSSLDSYITSHGTSSSSGGCASGPHYVFGGGTFSGTFVDEVGGTPHWHICF
ncbi:MAG: pilin [Minisyncoccota bacterium]